MTRTTRLAADRHDPSPAVTRGDRTPRWVLPGAIVADLAVVVAFVAIGRRSHDGDGGASGVATTAAPFLVALAVVWAASAAVAARTGGPVAAAMLRPERGVTIGIGTTVVGMLLRRGIWDRGTAVAFVVVALVFLTAGSGGWRAIAARLRHENDGSPAS